MEIELRPFAEADRAVVTAFGASVYDHWHRATTLHLMAGVQTLRSKLLSGQTARKPLQWGDTKP